eukprot:TRINITY_DN2384_c0_g1_i5.p1 TRINITY_DN2384_c0_g1~~TRINITY_DN2384_c0_g1_i5.p1  ORF type:complete len:326 (-),score=64.73 TRINITY_DN2384_c0_g1_i5:217-1194(-)
MFSSSSSHLRFASTLAAKHWTPVMQSASGDICEVHRIANTSDKLFHSVKLWRPQIAPKTPPKRLYFFIHATGFCKEQWIPVIKHMREFGSTDPVMAMDVVCHGDSETREGILNWESLAQDVVDVLDGMSSKLHESCGVGIPQLNITGIGHSMGGAICTLVDRLRPGVFNRMFLIEPIIFPPPNKRIPDYFMSQMALKRQSQFPSHTAMYERFKTKPPFNAFDDDALRCYVEHGAILNADGQGVSLKCTPEREAEFYRTGSSHNMFESLETSRTPALFSGGETTTTYTVDYLTMLQQKWGGPSVLKVYPQLSHFVPMEDPKQVCPI